MFGILENKIKPQSSNFNLNWCELEKFRCKTSILYFREHNYLIFQSGFLELKVIEKLTSEMFF